MSTSKSEENCTQRKGTSAKLDEHDITCDDSPYMSSDSSDDLDEQQLLGTVPHENRRQPGVLSAIRDTVNFYFTVAYFLIWGGSLDNCPTFGGCPQARVHLYSLCISLWLWGRPHYRTGSFQDDMLTNLRNVAIPGTGMPLSYVVSNRIFAILFLLIGYPMVCLIAGLRKGGFNIAAATQAYSEQLLCPQDWFSFWRLNCVLASFHGVVNKPPGFKQEDKWQFLKDAEANGIPTSPCMGDVQTLVIKDKNEEGGMGIHFFKNAMHGGDWIIQQKLTNNAFVRSLLPEDAPLSTLRVITASKGGMRTGSSSGDAAPLPGVPQRSDVMSLSCVFRAGRQGALTDHNSILFDVDLASGKVLKGTTNMHWYQLGLAKAVQTPWICRTHDITDHPDTGTRITGCTIPDITAIQNLCEDAHHRLLPDVPLAGWDVALTEEAGMCLLEVNLSCNFFRGKFDQRKYFEFVHEFFSFLDAVK